ncbi:hypothetical protein M1N91_01710, partial [Dehalococcoidia bacterium]|nr:hypothetical protein [Dehalococcoidia bacterium]
HCYGVLHHNLVRETEAMKPTDKACFGQVSKSAGCNENEPIGSLVKFSHGGRAFDSWAKTALPSDKVVGYAGGTIGVSGVTR